MRKIIIILILFLIGFSHPLLSKNLPTSLFGITLLDNVDKYLKNKEDNEPNIIDIQDMNFYYYYEDTINFTENLDFSEYFITTSKDGIINGIGASKKTNSCQDEQDKLIDVYSTLYDIKKEDFDNIFLRGLFNDKYIMYIDRDFIVYGNNSNLVLSFECEITAFEYTFYISLSTSDTFKSWDHALDVKEVPTINSDFLNRYDNLSGFGIFL